MIVPAGLALGNLLVGAIVIAALYFARELLVPIALAVLLSFVLAPLLRGMQRIRVPRAIAVIASVLMALAIALSLAAMVMIEVNQLSNDLPRYRTTLGNKIHNLHDTVGSAGILQNVSNLLKDLDNELKAPPQGEGPPDKPGVLRSGTRTAPIPVEVHQPDPSAGETLVALLRPLAAPLTTTAIVVIFLTFFLFQREDLRNRFIRLAGGDDLERTTAALDDAGRRLGRLFATQLILNAAFGAVIGLGLALIGVPSAPLWGLLATVLRFVPYIGGLLAAALPIALAAAVGDGWSMTLWTLALFVVVESLTGQVMEPLVCGRSAGLSPVAIVVAASFWTWLWGPLGLVLSTPVTLCLVVISRHVESLRFLDVMLGDRPALTPQQAAYQRMLTGDPIEAIEQARAFLKDGTVADYYQTILLGALKLAQADGAQGRLDDRRLENIHKTVLEVVEDLAGHEAKDSGAEPEAGEGKIVSLPTFGKPVYCIPGMGRLDDCAVLAVADVLRRNGINARTAAAATATEQGKAASICICFLEQDVSEARLDYTTRKIARTAAAARVVIAILGNDVTEPPCEPGKSGDYPHSLEDIVAAFKRTAPSESLPAAY